MNLCIILFHLGFLDQILGSFEIITILSQFLKFGKAFSTQQTNRYGHIYIRVMKQHMPWNAYFFGKSRKTDLKRNKIKFWRFSKSKHFRPYIVS